MTINEPENRNYAAVVVRIKSLNQLENCDNLVGVSLLGFQAIVSKDTKIGDVGIVFPAETQLDDEFISSNNLYRHSEKNNDKSQTGYIEDNRRIRAMKFRGNRSDCLFMPLTSLNYTKVNIQELNEGDVFDELNGHKICKKFTLPTRGVPRIEKNKTFKRVDDTMFPMHFDTDNYFRNKDSVSGDRQVIVTQKIHGTSFRVGNILVKRELSFIEKLLKKLGVKIDDHEYAYVYGSRKVIKDKNNPNQNHFYEEDIWSIEGAKVQDCIPENYILYGELIGWTPNGQPIQKDYTYRIPKGTCELYIYRIAVINPRGKLLDLTWDQVVEFCKDNGLKPVGELWRGLHKDFNVNDFLDQKYYDEGYARAIRLAEESPVDEGVCIRTDGLAPYILKAKGEKFFAHESKMLDEEVVDIEEEQKIDG